MQRTRDCPCSLLHSVCVSLTVIYTEDTDCNQLPVHEQNSVAMSWLYARARSVRTRSGVPVPLPQLRHPSDVEIHACAVVCQPRRTLGCNGVTWIRPESQ
eukprot:1240678-Amphidinium_carterae.1